MKTKCTFCKLTLAALVACAGVSAYAGSKVTAISVGSQSPSSITPGNSATFSVSASGNGDGRCTFSITSTLPTGANASFNANPTNGNGSWNSTLTISTTGGTPAGSYSFTVNGAGDNGSAANNGTLTVAPDAPNAYKITAATTTPAAGVGDQPTITLVDQFGNTVNFSGPTNLTFSGLSTADDGTHPTVADNTGAAVNEGTATMITFVNGVSSVGGSLKAYKAETKTLNVTDGHSSSTATGGAGVSLTVANVPPVAYALTLSRVPGTRLAVPLSSLAISSNHNTLKFTAETPTSGSATVITNSYGIIYTNTANVGDTVAYSVLDSEGGTAGNTITINIAAFATGQQTNPIVSGNRITLKYFGIPNLTYITQMSTNSPSTGPWVDIATNKAGPTGAPFYVTNTFSGTPPSPAFFRLEWSGN